MKINFYLTLFLTIQLVSFTIEIKHMRSKTKKAKIEFTKPPVLDLDAAIAGNEDKLHSEQSTKTNASANKKSTVKPNKNMPHKTENLDPNDLWEQLFTVSRTVNCEKTTLYLNLLNEVLHGFGMFGSTSNKFHWVKEWGYGPASYFFDYIDNVMRDFVVMEFKAIYKNASSFSNLETVDYHDKLNLNLQMLHADPNSKAKYARKIAAFNKKTKTPYFATSINTVQFHKFLPANRWFIKNKFDDYAKEFVLKYDMDEDGRLNARELILGSIRENKLGFDNPMCQFCYKTIIPMIDSMFEFFNCAHTGFIDAEQMWKGFTILKRSTNKYNIFSIENNLSIRTNAINDVVLKSAHAKDGFISKDEFRQAILLGFWDRQTSESGIIDDDSRNLKKLRWSDDGSRDTLAYNYMKETIILELKQKAEERLRNMVRYKNQNVVKTQRK